MAEKSTDILLEMARDLRSNQTYVETILWEKLRCKRLNGIKFYRQYVIGKYIADFYCRDVKLVIELDGPIHDSREAARRDAYRDKAMVELGIQVFRVPNDRVVHDIHGVMHDIVERYISKT